MGHIVQSAPVCHTANRLEGELAGKNAFKIEDLAASFQFRKCETGEKERGQGILLVCALFGFCWFCLRASW